MIYLIIADDQPAKFSAERYHDLPVRISHEQLCSDLTTTGCTSCNLFVSICADTNPSSRPPTKNPSAPRRHRPFRIAAAPIWSGRGEWPIRDPSPHGGHWPSPHSCYSLPRPPARSRLNRRSRLMNSRYNRIRGSSESATASSTNPNLMIFIQSRHCSLRRMADRHVILRRRSPALDQEIRQPEDRHRQSR